MYYHAWAVYPTVLGTLAQSLALSVSFSALPEKVWEKQRKKPANMAIRNLDDLVRDKHL